MSSRDLDLFTRGLIIRGGMIFGFVDIREMRDGGDGVVLGRDAYVDGW